MGEGAGTGTSSLPMPRVSRRALRAAPGNAPFLWHSKARVQGLALSSQEGLRSSPGHSRLENPCASTPGRGEHLHSPAAPGLALADPSPRHCGASCWD